MSSLDWLYQHQLIGTRSKQNPQNEEVTAEHEARISQVMNRLLGQMQGIEISQQATIIAGAPKTEFAHVMEQQNIALAECLKSCTTALSSTAQSTENTFKYVRAFDDARQLIGTIGDVRGGGPANTFDVLIAQDRSKQMAGSIDGKLALDFMNAPPVKISENETTSSKLPTPEMPS